MADRVERPIREWQPKAYAYDCKDADAIYAKLETELRDLKSLHADIIDQGRKVQIAASGESKYGAMSDSEFIEWMLGKLEGKC